MKIAITGCTGFIGHKFIELYKNKYSLIGITRNKSSFNEDGLEIQKSDYSVESLINIFQNVDAVLHLASQKAFSKDHTGVQAYTESILLLENVLIAANQCSIKNVVNISSRCVYGIYTQTKFNELSTTHPINKYGVMKLCGEIISEYYNNTFGMKIKNLRLAQVVGYPMKDKYMFNTFLERIRKNETIEILGQGAGKRDYIYVDDVCRAIEIAIQRENVSGIYNIGSGIGLSNLDVAKKMISIFESDSKIEVIKNSPLDKTNIVLDTNKAKNELGFVNKYDMDSILYDIKNKIRRE